MFLSFYYERNNATFKKQNINSIINIINMHLVIQNNKQKNKNKNKKTKTKQKQNKTKQTNKQTNAIIIKMIMITALRLKLE